MPEMVEGIKILFGDLPFCKACVSAKLYKQYKKGPVKNKAIKFFKQIYINICNKKKTFNVIGNKYYLIFINDISR